MHAVEKLQREVVGRNAQARLQWIGLALVEFFAILVVLSVDSVLGVDMWPNSSPFLVWAGVAGLFALAAAGSYLRAGLLAVCAMCALPIFGIFLFILGDGVVRLDPEPLRVVLRAGGWGLLFGLPIGTVGYVAGIGLRTVGTRKEKGARN